MKPLDRVVLTDKLVSFEGRFIHLTDSASESEAVQKKLQSQIESGALIDSNASLRFLSDSFSAPTQEEQINANTSTEDNLQPPLTDIPSTPAAAGIERGGPSVDCLMDRSDESETGTSRTDGHWSILFAKMDRHMRLLQESLDEQKKIRKILQRAFPKNTTRTAPPDRPFEESSQEPINHNGKNLLKIGHRNMDAVRYTVFVARTLWSDDELSVARLYPQRSKRQALSPTRSEKLLKCIKTKYGLEEEDTRPCVAAVNQLCIDLANGRRKRK